MNDLLVLMGYMGSGKSTVGTALAQKLKSDYIDLDAYIEQRESKTITEIFELKGALYFRKIERKVLVELLKSNSKLVIALGGGTPCYYENIDLIKEKAQSIYLKGSVKELSQRLLKDKASRPLLSNVDSLEQMQEFVGKHLFERSHVYNQADYIVDIDSKDLNTVVDECLAHLA